MQQSEKAVNMGEGFGPVHKVTSQTTPSTLALTGVMPAATDIVNIITVSCNKDSVLLQVTLPPPTVSSFSLFLSCTLPFFAHIHCGNEDLNVINKRPWPKLL